jgi:hypothetical protein
MSEKRVSQITEVLRKYPQGNAFLKKNKRVNLIHLDKRRLNSNFIIFKETEDVDQLFSKSMRTRVKDVGSEHENVRLK